jgi:DNA-binding transcriptional regulator YiaG
MIAVTARGCRVGQDHHRAKLTDAELALLLTMRETDGLSYGRLAQIFEVPKDSVAAWCKRTRRNSHPDRFVRGKAAG